MPAFHSAMSVLVRFVVRSSSTNSRPALRAAVTTRGAIYRPELRTSSQTSAQISRTASDCHMTTANAIRPATTSRRSQGQARLTRSPFRSCSIHSSSTSKAVEAAPRGVVGFEVDRRCLLAAVDRGDAASIAGWCELGHTPLGQVAALA